MFNPRTILRIMGTLLFIAALMFAVCLGVALFYGEERLDYFIIPIAVSVGVGLLCRLVARGGASAISRRDGYLCVSLSWTLFAAVGVLPFIISGYEPRLAQAFFESMSGFTTTGATALDNIDQLPHSILLWRSLTHWLGGMGIVFFTLVILPGMGTGSLKLFSAESTGLKMEKLHPRVSTTARWLWAVYLFLPVSCTTAYYVAGMSLFDAVNHAFSTIATGGFSTHQDSIAWFHSTTIEGTVTVFMFLSGVNFTLIYMFFIKRRFKAVLRDSELRAYIAIVLGASATLAVILVVWRGFTPVDALRESLFYCTSLQTTTGFTTIDPAAWPPATWLLLMTVCFFGACSGSTSGGVKSVRILTAFKAVMGQFRSLIHPNAILPVRLNGNPVSSHVVHTVFAMIAAFIILAFFGTVAYLAMGMPLLDAFSCTLTMLTNAGPAFGHEMGPLSSWSQMNDAGLWLGSFLMLAGRLEIFSLLLPFVPAFWKDQ